MDQRYQQREDSGQEVLRGHHRHYTFSRNPYDPKISGDLRDSKSGFSRKASEVTVPDGITPSSGAGSYKLRYDQTSSHYNYDIHSVPRTETTTPERHM